MTDIDASLRRAPVVDKAGYAYLIHPLTDGVPRVEPALLEAWADWASQRPELVGATLLVAPEAMGLPLAAALSLRTGIPYVCVRKRSYGLPGERAAYSETGYGQSTLHVNDVRSDDRVVVVDDIVSTGGTLTGLLATLQGLEAHVQGVLVFVDKGRGAAVTAPFGVPLAAMRKVRVEGGKVIVE